MPIELKLCAVGRKPVKLHVPISDNLITTRHACTIEIITQ